MGGQSRRQSMRTLQGCCGGVCAWILLVLVSCGRAGGPVVVAECERARLWWAAPGAGPGPICVFKYDGSGGKLREESLCIFA